MGLEAPIPADQVVPEDDSTANNLVADVVGSKADAAVSVVDTASSVIAYLKGIIGSLGEVNRDMPWLVDWWENGTLNGTVWTETLDGAGTGVFGVDADEGVPYWNMDTEAVTGSDVRLRAIQRWMVTPSLFSDDNFVVETLNMEFMARLPSTITTYNNTFVMMGFTETGGQSNSSASNDIAAFILVSDTITTRTSKNGTDEDTDISGIVTDVTAWNKYRIEIYEDGIRFYANDTLVATHTTTIPDQFMYALLGVRAKGAASVGIDIGPIRIWYESKV